MRDGKRIDQAQTGDSIVVILDETPFYVEAGGQVNDTGEVRSVNGDDWLIRIQGSQQPVDGLILHMGIVDQGQPTQGDKAIASYDMERRLDIMRNHTATHLLHAALRSILGDHVRQAGSLVAPDRLRFDFTHSNALSADELDQVENWVNQAILSNYPLMIEQKERQEAISGGAMALFGETYGDEVRTVQIGHDDLVSYELCGGTHVHETSVIGSFLILQEGSVAAGIRRIEALTGREALALIRSRLKTLEVTAKGIGTTPEDVSERVEQMQQELNELKKNASSSRKHAALEAFQKLEAFNYQDLKILTGQLPDADADTLRELADRFRGENTSSVVVLASIVNTKPLIIAAVTEHLNDRGLHAGELVKAVASLVGGSGGGKPTMAQAGGNDASRLGEALAIVPGWVEDHLQPI
jgi:alanyl-tRNA synthetase